MEIEYVTNVEEVSSKFIKAAFNASNRTEQAKSIAAYQEYMSVIMAIQYLSKFRDPELLPQRRDQLIKEQLKRNPYIDLFPQELSFMEPLTANIDSLVSNAELRKATRVTNVYPLGNIASRVRNVLGDRISLRAIYTRGYILSLGS
jgi:hypothetical protein